jgi:hypothetical protein
MNNFLAYTNKVLSNEDIKFLNDDYDKHEPQVIKRFGNLFHLEQRFPPEVHEHITSKLHPTVPVAHYYLNYTEGSFCRMHHDNDVSLTTITLIDQDHNLEGGETIVNDPFEKKHYEEYHTFSWQDPKDYAFDGSFICPRVVDLKVGETLFLHQMHGVAKVRTGFRKVFITWHANQTYLHNTSAFLGGAPHDTRKGNWPKEENKQ